MAYFKFKGTKVFYKIRGQGEPVILLHGNSVSSRMFSPLLKLYSKHFQVIVLDFPGHGKSDRLENFEVDFWNYKSTVVYALINELKLQNVSVIGTSGGALVAINLGLNHPDKIYMELQTKNSAIQIHLFEKGKHPAMLSNKKDFFSIVRSTLSAEK